MTLLQDIRETLRLAAPIALTQVSWIIMNLVDTAMVSPLGTEALGAVALGTSLYFSMIVFFLGLIGAVGPITAQRHGAKEAAGVVQILQDGWWMAILSGILVSGVIQWVSIHNTYFGVTPELSVLTADYMVPRVLGFLPTLLFCVYKGYLEGTGLTLPALWLSVLANLFNVFANWILIYGNLGFPAMGVAGAGLASAFSNIFQCVGISMIVHRRISLRWPKATRPGLFLLARIGSPMGVHSALEVGIFALAAILMNRFGVVPTAAHQIAIQLATCTFMVATGLAVAASTRVGQNIGKNDILAAERAGWTSMGMTLGFMGISASIFLTFPEKLVHLFSEDPAVLDLGAKLLRIAGAFQLFDGLQAVASGALRGAGDTKFSLYVSLGGYWLIGFPLCLLFAFGFGWGPVGLWWALAVALAVTAIGLVHRFYKGVWKTLGRL